MTTDEFYLSVLTALGPPPRREDWIRWDVDISAYRVEFRHMALQSGIVIFAESADHLYKDWCHVWHNGAFAARNQ